MSAIREDFHSAAVAVEISAQVVTARLVNAPANALSPAVLDGLEMAVDVVEREGARTFVICSGVPGFFAAGADIKHMKALDADGFAAYGSRMRRVFERISRLAAVSIAAIEGQALGGGLELALACTLRIGSTSARLGLPEIKLGLIPGAGGTQRLPRIVGRSHALDMLFTGREAGGDEARSIGLLDRLVRLGHAEAEAVAIAHELAAFSAPALAAIERCVDAALGLDHEDGLEFEAAEEQALFEDGEAMEGIAAFVARRAPVFASALAGAGMQVRRDGRA